MTSVARSLRPLDRLTSIKVKLGVVILGSVVATTASIFYGWRVTSLRIEYRIALTALVFLVVTQVLAHGMTSPLRRMAVAARSMAAGNWDTPVHTGGRDEVGELARAFSSMAAQLSAVDAQRRDLLANVSHELRTPLAALQARLENLIDGVEPTSTDSLSGMLRSVDRLGHIVGQLMDLSRLEAGTLTVEHRPFGLADVVADAADEVLDARPGADIQTAIAADLRVYGDPERLHQVLVNLLDNAARHSPPGCSVHVHAEALPTDGTHVRIRVVDSGPGVPAGERDRIFDRFARLDPARASGTGGAGLGLAIARSIVELHGGSICVTEPPSGGCCFELMVPRAVA